MAAAAVLLALPLLLGQLLADAAVFADPRTWLLGPRIGVLSTAVPYALDQVVLTRMGRARFALLLALLPATAAIVGATIAGAAADDCRGGRHRAGDGRARGQRGRGDTVGPTETRRCNHAGRPPVAHRGRVELIALTREVADKLLDPIVDAHERSETYPDGVFAQLGAAGLLSLPQPEEWGGGGQPYEVYLQVLEEIAARWAAVAVAVSVHSLSSHPLLAFGTDEQKQRWLPEMLSGDQIGAYSLSEPQAGSDAAALRCAATADRRRVRRQRRPSRGSPTAASPTSTRCSRGPAKGRGASPASWCPAICPG